MLKFVEFIQKRPKDRTIRSVRAGYGLVLAALLVLANADYSLPYASVLGEPNATYAEYALAVLVLVPGAVAAFGWCVAKRKTVRLAQLGGAIFLFVLASSITATQIMAPAAPAASGTLSASELAGAATVAPETEEPVDVSGWLRLLAILPILSAVTGKMVTEKCLKHGEVIKKIRV
ncbi:MAG: hypothetical protein WA194_01935 [Patescibacteria group bacterium]